MNANFKNYLNDIATPFYIFDTDILEKQISKIRKAIGDNGLCYAIKANPFIIKAVEPFVDKFEVCSPGEFKICEKAGIDIDKIILSGVYKNYDDIAYVVKKYGSRILYTAESYNQWILLDKISTEFDIKINCLLRLSSGNQFGMDRAVIRKILSVESNISVTGIHYFPGTQKKSLNKYERELGMLKDFCRELEEQYESLIVKPLAIEYGPGLPICYFEDDKNMEDQMLSSLSRALSGPSYDGGITIEIGRYIASTCGAYVTTVVDKKTNNDMNYCIVDGGIHHVNYFGQMMAMKRPPIRHYNTIADKFSNERCSDEVEWTVCGSLCTANDVLVKQLTLSELNVGDKLVFDKAGAYSVTEGVSLLLSRDLPQVILYSKKNGEEIARKHEPTWILNSK